MCIRDRFQAFIADVFANSKWIRQITTFHKPNEGLNQSARKPQPRALISKIIASYVYQDKNEKRQPSNKRKVKKIIKYYVKGKLMKLLVLNRISWIMMQKHLHL
eukprot:TRINITY_DN4533_c0_g2_i1.p2 TRINITY_DN4533_c0_g2~~TRINITY_DN4533_c0_g2_i1.p2  ORF type:complete len:104 (+),score=5.97 TRINITY_DN4533_c0_g2_i1:63-374(+)